MDVKKLSEYGESNCGIINFHHAMYIICNFLTGMEKHGHRFFSILIYFIGYEPFCNFGHPLVDNNIYMYG